MQCSVLTSNRTRVCSMMSHDALTWQNRDWPNRIDWSTIPNLDWQRRCDWSTLPIDVPTTPMRDRCCSPPSSIRLCRSLNVIFSNYIANNLLSLSLSLIAIDSCRTIACIVIRFDIVSCFFVQYIFSKNKLNVESFESMCEQLASLEHAVNDATQVSHCFFSSFAFLINDCSAMNKLMRN